MTTRDYRATLASVKYFIPLLFACLTLGCVQGTTVWENGQKIFATNGDAAGLDFGTATTHLRATTLTHSSLITARGGALSQVITASGDAVAKAAPALKAAALH